MRNGINRVQGEGGAGAEAVPKNASKACSARRIMMNRTGRCITDGAGCCSGATLKCVSGEAEVLRLDRSGGQLAARAQGP